MAAPKAIFTQINLHHCKSASAVLARRMARMHTCISLVQEPWLYKTKITNLRGCGQLICGRGHNSRACLLVKGLRVEAIPKYCVRDLATAKFWYKDDKGGMREVVVALVYFPYESNLCPTAEVIELIKISTDPSV